MIVHNWAVPIAESPKNWKCDGKSMPNGSAMSRQERDRLTILTRVKQKVPPLVVAAGLLGLVTAKPSGCGSGIKFGAVADWCTSRAAAVVRERILGRYDQRYADFGPALAAEYLAREDRSM
jgi:hypothetical protein